MCSFMIICVISVRSLFSGFAVNLDLLMDNKYVIPVDSKPGYVEDAFLVQFATVKDLEPKAKQCTKVCVETACCTFNQKEPMKHKSTCYFFSMGS